MIRFRKRGARLPVRLDEFGTVWRDAGNHLEIDTRKTTFRAETGTFSSFIGDLKNGRTKMPRSFRLAGNGDAWSFLGKLPDSSSLFFAVMNGSIDLRDGKSLRYLFLGGRDIRMTIGGKAFLTLLGGNTVNLAIKSENSSLADAPFVYVTFFRNRSVETPAELTFSARSGKWRPADRTEPFFRNFRRTEKPSGISGKTAVRFPITRSRSNSKGPLQPCHPHDRMQPPFPF